MQLQQHLAPGDAMLSNHNEQKVEVSGCERKEGPGMTVTVAVRLFVALFGDPFRPLFCNLRECGEVSVARNQLRRNFPRMGDATLAGFDINGLQQAMLVSRPDGTSTFRLAYAFHTPILAKAHWVPECLALVVKGLNHVVHQNFNRPGIQKLRKIDADFYVILSLCHFKRGPPMLPHTGPEEPDVTICGEDGLQSSWTRHAVQTSRFRAAEYMQLFIERLGYSLRFFGTLDGQMLVPYQCAVRRDKWQRLRKDVLNAFSSQKAAYRRMNGGAAAPELKEGRSANFKVGPVKVGYGVAAELPQLVVRRTFFGVEELIDKTLLRRAKSSRHLCTCDGDTTQLSEGEANRVVPVH
ncbi:unnamed protein product [Effrenium voratum]|uniref:Uncharacterized protein n=1 Tax=Effrenium voratum TaxID=2562239 RepID=A0AA36HL09_9DINO|nr:unnamed protein product [Effrenium voratum]